LKSLSATLNQKFDFNISEWEQLLKQELKIDQVDNKSHKKYSDLGQWPTLSLDSLKVSQLSSSSSWRKASQSYFGQPSEGFIQEDLANGVKIFFFNSYTPLELDTPLLEKFLDQECEVYCLNQVTTRSSHKFKTFNESQLILARKVHDEGGSSALELAYLASQLINNLEDSEWRIGIFLGHDIFKTIAKLRALRLMAMRVQQLAKVSIPFKIIALNSYRDWTIFERYSNILRNDTQVMGAYMGAADVIQSSGYNSILELETGFVSDEHADRSSRIARNTCHILALESMLGVVEDPASGSYHLEGLSQKYAQISWELMQEYLKSSNPEEFLEQKLQEQKNYRTQRLKTRKDLMAGINDFPDVKEKLAVKLAPKFYRSAYIFEELRLRVGKIKRLPRVEIHLKGQYAGLSSRINFIKNYFELIGLQVIDPLELKQSNKDNIMVLCAQDEDYVELAQSINHTSYFQSYIAGRLEMDGFYNIYSGQDIYAVLEKLVEKLEAIS